MASRLPVFGRPMSDSSPSDPSPFGPPGNASSNGLFSPSPPPRTKSTSGNSLFAGATPAAKSSKSAASKFGLGAGASNAFGNNTAGRAPAAPKFSFNAPSTQLGPTKLPRLSPTTRPTGFSFGDAPAAKPMARRNSVSRQERYSSPTDGDDEDDAVGPRIFEDDTLGEPTPQDESGDSGMYGDEEDADDMEDGYGQMVPAVGRTPYTPSIRPGVIYEPNQLITTVEDLMDDLRKFIDPSSDLPKQEYFDDDDDMEMNRPIGPSLEQQQERFARCSKYFLQAVEANLPKDSLDSDLHKAYYVASVVLPLHHSTASTAETLRHWLTYHHPSPTKQVLLAVKTFHPSCASSPEYWDVIHRLVVRGEVVEVVELLGAGKWDALSIQAASTANSFSKSVFGGKRPTDKRYTPDEIDTIKEAISTLRAVLDHTPGKGRSSYVSSSSPFFPPMSWKEDYPGTAADWRIWRGQVVKAHEEFKVLAGGGDDSYLDDETDDSLYAPYKPINNGGSFGFGIGPRAPKKARLPQDIAHQLRVIYEIVSGDQGAVLAACEQWEEAAVALTMWCRPIDKDEDADDRELDDDMPEGDYRMLIRDRKARELAELPPVIETVVEELPLDPQSGAEIAVGGILAGDPRFVDELAKLSLVIASAVVEIGGYAGWIEREKSSHVENDGNLLTGFDDEELAVLHASSNTSGYARMAEDILREYASGLFAIEWLNKEADVHGWEVGVGVLERVHKGDELAAKLLTLLPINNDETRIERLLQFCAEKHLSDTQAYIASSYAASLPPDSAYGERLHYYSYSPSSRPEIHSIITDLISRTLLASSPFPREAELDDTLRRFLRSPDQCDSDVLRYELSGYAALRVFYNLREHDPSTAAKALTAVIRSAGEAVDGGYWDDVWNGAVELRFLGALIPEMVTLLTDRALAAASTAASVDGTPRASRNTAPASTGQSVQTGPWRFEAMKVLGDLEAAGSQAWAICENFWEECKRAGSGAGVEESWVDVGASGSAGGGRWRAMRKWSLEDAVRVLRLRFAEELARAWLNGETP